MSLQLAAQHLASRGRGPDTQLVHMAPQEVAGLQALARAAGGTLTVNPDTGLAEAGFLKKLLPTLIGAALTATTGIPAWAIGLGVGGVEAARTGDLGKGLMAGLGAYGGAGLASGLSGAGAGAAQEAAMGAVPQGATTAAHTAAQQAAMEGLTGAAANEAAANASQQLLAQGFGSDEAIRNIAAGQASQQFAAQPLQARLGQGLSALGTEAGRSQALASMGGGSSAIKYGLSALAPITQMEPAEYKGSGPNPFRYRYEQEMPEGPNMDGSAEALQYRGRYVPYADGGPVSQMSQQAVTDTLINNGGQIFAKGGSISHLGDYSDGGRLLKGPGDGVSDSIPATIANKRPARLADGEFVVPARIVSELGNGSTEAGARKLYAMMDRVQSARKKSIGKKKVAVNSRADRALPA